MSATALARNVLEKTLMEVLPDQASEDIARAISDLIDAKIAAHHFANPGTILTGGDACLPTADDVRGILK